MSLMILGNVKRLASSAWARLQLKKDSDSENKRS